VTHLPHPALDQAHAAIRALRNLHADTPQETAALILGIAGDGTGQTSLIGELTTLLARLARQAAPLLPADAGQYVTEACATAELTIDQQAGDYLAGALDILEQPGRRPNADFRTRHGIPAADPEPAFSRHPDDDGDPAPSPQPDQQPQPIAA